MAELSEHERVMARFLVEAGLSFNEVGDRILKLRSDILRRRVAEEIAAMFDRKLYPLREGDN